MICTLSVGFITPPLGENLFIASGISKLDYEVIAARAIPFMLALAAIGHNDDTHRMPSTGESQT